MPFVSRQSTLPEINALQFLAHFLFYIVQLIYALSIYDGMICRRARQGNTVGMDFAYKESYTILYALSIS